MDLLDRLLAHDAWTTNQLLIRCAELTDEQLDRVFAVDGRSVRALLAHLIGNVEVWTDLLIGRPVRRHESDSPGVSQLKARHEAASAEFADFARQIQSEGRLDDFWIDTLDEPPREKTCGGAVLHVLTHNMHHRAHLLLLLGWLGLKDLPEGDLLSWEAANA